MDLEGYQTVYKTIMTLPFSLKSALEQRAQLRGPVGCDINLITWNIAHRLEDTYDEGPTFAARKCRHGEIPVSGLRAQ